MTAFVLVDDVLYHPSQIEKIATAASNDCHLVTLTDGGVIRAFCKPAQYTVVPNNTRLRALIVCDLGENLPDFLVYERPIFAWRVDLMSEDGEFSDPIYGGKPTDNERMCVLDPDTGEAWIPEDEAFTTRELAVEGLQKRLTKCRVHAKQKSAA